MLDFGPKNQFIIELSLTCPVMMHHPPYHPFRHLLNPHKHFPWATPVSWCDDSLGGIAGATGGERMIDRKHKRKCWCPCREGAELNKENKWTLVKQAKWFSTGNWTGGNMRFHWKVRRPVAECKKKQTKKTSVEADGPEKETGWRIKQEKMRGTKENKKKKERHKN